MTVLVVVSDDGDVTLCPDGSAWVDLAKMHVARRDLLGYVVVDTSGTVRRSRIEDAYVHVPLRPHVMRAAENAAVRLSRRARKAARQIAAAKGPVRRYEPGTLEHLVMLAEGGIREDGWPKGWMPL